MEESRCDDAGNGNNTLHSVGGYSADASSRGAPACRSSAPSGFGQKTGSVMHLREGELDLSGTPDRFLSRLCGNASAAPGIHWVPIPARIYFGGRRRVRLVRLAGLVGVTRVRLNALERASAGSSAVRHPAGQTVVAPVASAAGTVAGRSVVRRRSHRVFCASTAVFGRSLAGGLRGNRSQPFSGGRVYGQCFSGALVPGCMRVAS